MVHTAFALNFLLIILSYTFARTCTEQYDCYAYEKCINGYCEVDRKLPGEKCYSNVQCGICCTRDYACKDAKENTPCKDDFDPTGLAVGLVLVGVIGTATIIGAVCWSKQYKR